MIHAWHIEAEYGIKKPRIWILEAGGSKYLLLDAVYDFCQLLESGHEGEVQI